MKLSLAAFILAQSLDTSSTCVAIHSGLHENNSLFGQSCSKTVGIKSAVTTTMLFTFNKSPFWGQHKTARSIIIYSLSSMPAFYGTRNYIRIVRH